eukprot:scaffold257781_cov17-Tisochrysis_lutea.AAC.1
MGKQVWAEWRCNTPPNRHNNPICGVCGLLKTVLESWLPGAPNGMLLVPNSGLLGGELWAGIWGLSSRSSSLWPREGPWKQASIAKEAWKLAKVASSRQPYTKTDPAPPRLWGARTLKGALESWFPDASNGVLIVPNGGVLGGEQGWG